MKKIIALAVVGVIAVGGAVFAGIDTPVAVDLSSIATEQAAKLQTIGKYQHIVTKDYTVNEYQTPDGKRGYEVIYEDALNVYRVGYGPEASSRTQTYPKRVATST